MHKFPKLVLVLAIAAFLIPVAAAQTIKIAFMGPLTGGAAFIGLEALGFSKVVLDDFNARTGLNVELVEGDTEINPDTGRIVAERVAGDDDIYVVVGPMGSQVCESTQPVFEAAGLAHVTPSCTNTALTLPGTPTFFRPIPTDADQSRTVVAYWLENLMASTFYLVDDQSSYAVGLNDEVENLLLDAGIITYDRTSITQDEIDFSSIATAAIQSGADVVFFPNQITSQAAGLAIALEQQGFEGTYFLPDGGFVQEWVNIAGEAAEGALVTFFAPDPKQVATMAPFNDAYRAEFGDEFGAFGGASALATFVALEALESCLADLSRACVVDALTNLDMMTTPLGVPVSFGEGNQAAGSTFFLFEVRDGTFNLIQ